MKNFLVENVFVIIGTIIFMISHTDFFKDKKIFWLFLHSFVVLSNTYVVFVNDDIFSKVSAGLYAFIGGCYFVDCWKYKKPTKIVLDLGENTQYVIDKKDHFKDNFNKAKQGDLMSICNLGLAYRKGIGTNIDLEKSKKMFQLLIQSNDPFWSKEGEKELEITKKLIKERNKAILNEIKDAFDI